MRARRRLQRVHDRRHGRRDQPRAQARLAVDRVGTRSASGSLRDYYLDGVLRFGGWGVGAEVGYLDQALPDLGEDANYGGLYAGAKVLHAEGALTLYAGAAYVDGTLEERHLADVDAVRVQAGALTVFEAGDMTELVPRLELQLFHGLGDADFSAVAALFSLGVLF